MSTVAEVKLWGRTIGAVSLEEDNEIAAFEYDPAFARSGIETRVRSGERPDPIYNQRFVGRTV